jgi:two-component system, cell cycle sensor histidine kinase and response regulator CckA
LRLRNLLYVGAGALLVALVVVSRIVVSATIEPNFARIEQEQVRADLRRAADALESEAATLEALVRDWAPWDDAYQFMVTSSPAFVESNLPDVGLANLQLNAVLFLDLDGNPVYATGFDLEKGQRVEVPSGVYDALRVYPQLIQHSDSLTGGTGILMLTEGPALVSSWPILTSEELGPARGSLVWVRFLDDRVIADLSKRLGLPIRLRSYSEARSDAVLGPVLPRLLDGPIAMPESSGVIAGYALLTDMFGAPALVSELELPRVVYQEGRASVGYYTLALSGVVLIFGAVTFWLVYRLTRAQKQQEERESRHRAVVEQASDGIVLLDAETGFVMEANPAVSIMLGYPIEEIAGHNIFRFVDGERFEPENERLLGATLGHNVALDLPLRHRGGRVVYTEVRTNAVTCGARPAISVVLRDVSERRATLQALRESEERHRALVESVTDVIFTSGADGRITYCSPVVERNYGYSVAEVVNRPFSEFVHPDDRAASQALFAQALQTHLLSCEFRVLAKDGTCHYIRASARARVEDGRSVEMTGALADITEHRKLELQLLQSQKMETVGRLAGGVAHDFNNLLTAIIGFASFARERVPEGSEAWQDMGQVLRTANRAAELTRQLLAFSRRQVISRAAVNLNTVILGLEKMLQRLIGEDIELSVIPAPDLGVVLADPAQWEQVLVNLAVNARDAMPHGGKLVIATSNAHLGPGYTADEGEVEPGDYVVLRVTDSGQGMDGEVRSHLFEPFFTTKEVGKGTGLGLATVYGIVKQNHGHIAFTSEIGKGTSFLIHLPRVDDAAQSRHEDPADAALPRGSETVLFAEDDAAVRTFVARSLRGLGYTVVEASGPEEALSLASAYGYHMDLLLTDVVMPKMSGKELAHRLHASVPHIPVLYVSGYAEDTIAHKGELDAVAFLSKPFSVGALAAKVRAVLDSGRPAAP